MPESRVTCVICRVIGNDLPPLHDPAQSYRNLEVLLRNEPRYPDTERLWIVNRIVDRGSERRILELLESKGEPSVHLPFDRAVYERIVKQPGDPAGDIERHLARRPHAFRGWDLEDDSLEAKVELHRKILYLTNVNAARNVALGEGRRRARWIALLDGGCLLSPQSWSALRQTLDDAPPAVSYLLLPMVRRGPSGLEAPSGSTLLHEPHIVFRAEAPLEFDESHRYGHRDKLDLLERIGAPMDWPYLAEDLPADRDGFLTLPGASVSRLSYGLGSEAAAVVLAHSAGACERAASLVDETLERVGQWVHALEVAQSRLVERSNRGRAISDSMRRRCRRKQYRARRGLEEAMRSYAAKRRELRHELEGYFALLRPGADPSTAMTNRARYRARNASVAAAIARLDGREPAPDPPPVAPPDETFVLYRILGNDLPPRHRAGQTATTLRFILEHEPELPRCEKCWVVNRIVDPQQEQEVIDLLRAHHQKFLHLPFRAEEYETIDFDFDGFHRPGFLVSREYERMPARQRLRAVTRANRSKILYAMNVNGARNAAIREGRRRADWVLPLDGGCFVTQAAWREIRFAASRAGGSRYLILPMARLRRNHEALDEDRLPPPTEEPQIGFHRDAGETFDESAVYGLRDKVLLLRKLGVRGVWDRWGFDPWETGWPAPSPEAGRFVQAGALARLVFGDTALERPGRLPRNTRSRARSVGVHRLLARLDRRRAEKHFDPERLQLINEGVLERECRAWRQGEAKIVRLVDLLRSRADPLVRGMATRFEIRQAFERVTVLALASRLCGVGDYGRRAAEIVRAGWLDRVTRLDPREAAAAAPFGWHVFLDAARLLARSGALTGDEVDCLRTWCSRFLKRLRSSRDGRRASFRADDRGTRHALTVAATAAFTGRLEVLLSTVQLAKARIGAQFDDSGGQPATPDGDRGLVNLHTWCDLARIAEGVGVDLWHYRTHDGRCLEKAFGRALFSTAGRPEDEERLLPLWFAARQRYPALERKAAGCRHHHLARPWFDASTGIRPFWNLGWA